MTYFRLGVLLTVVWLALWLFVVNAKVDDWWGGPAVFGMVVMLYWALGRQFFPEAQDSLVLPGEESELSDDADRPTESDPSGDTPDPEASVGPGSSEDTGVPAALGDRSASD